MQTKQTKKLFEEWYADYLKEEINPLEKIYLNKLSIKEGKESAESAHSAYLEDHRAKQGATMTEQEKLFEKWDRLMYKGVYNYLENTTEQEKNLPSTTSMRQHIQERKEAFLAGYQAFIKANINNKRKLITEDLLKWGFKEASLQTAKEIFEVTDKLIDDAQVNGGYSDILEVSLKHEDLSNYLALKAKHLKVD